MKLFLPVSCNTALQWVREDGITMPYMLVVVVAEICVTNWGGGARYQAK